MSGKILLVGDGTLADHMQRYLTEQRMTVIPEDGGKEVEEIQAVVDVISGPAETKREHLIDVEARLPASVPIYSSTLHVCATRIASWLQEPGRLLGFSPLFPAEMEVQEVSRPLQAESDASWEEHLTFWTELGKKVEQVGGEPGLVFPRTFALLVNEAAFALQEGVASPEDIDLAMKKGTRFPHGPLEWADEIGIDEVLWILKGLFEELGEDRYRPASLLRRMVYAGYTGQRAGRGFYSYSKAAKKEISRV